MTVTVVDCEEYRELKRDAERYRYLRERKHWDSDDAWAVLSMTVEGVEFDGVVDSKMAKAKQEQGK